MRKTSRFDGFTLTEVLISILIFSLACLSVLALFASGTLSHRRGIDHLDAASAVQKVIADVQRLATGARPRDVLGAPIPDMDPDWSYDVRFEATNAEETAYYVQVTLKWRVKGEVQSETVNTVVLKRAY